MENKEEITIKNDFLSKPLCPLEDVKLILSRCLTCGEVFLGKAITCRSGVSITGASGKGRVGVLCSLIPVPRLTTIQVTRRCYWLSDRLSCGRRPPEERR